MDIQILLRLRVSDKVISCTRRDDVDRWLKKREERRKDSEILLRRSN